MSQATQAAFDAQIELDEESLFDVQRPSAAAQGDVHLAVYEDFADIEQDWRAFEQTADGTVFQSFDWLTIWQRHIGSVSNVAPAIVTGRDGRGRLLFILPFGVERGGFVRRLTWLGTDLCDYNGPLLATDFGRRFDDARFVELWRAIVARLKNHPALWFDAVCLDKMQDTVGAQRNPFIALGVAAHPNGAYRTPLGSEWDKFYHEKRSSATRRRDRTKRKKLGEIGEVRFITPADDAGTALTLDTLMQQKSQAFAAMGVTDIFVLPGYREFYHALAARRDFVHVSRLDVGALIAAANLGMTFRGSYYHLLASYDAGETSKYGPGAAHMHDLMKHAIEHGCHTFDFTIGDERYKREWCEGHITLHDHFSAVTLRGWPVALRCQAVGRLKHWIKQTPALWDMAYKVRAFIGPLMKRLRG